MLVVLLNFDWNRAKPWFNARISEAIDCPFAIVGDLSPTWEKQAEQDRRWRALVPWPHGVAQDIHIRNPSGITATAPADASAMTLQPADMAIIKQFAFSLNPLALLERKISISLLELLHCFLDRLLGFFTVLWHFVLLSGLRAGPIRQFIAWGGS